MRSERGASLLEFAVVCPILMICVLGYFDIARVLTVQSILDEATGRAAARAKVVTNLDYNPRELDSTSTEFKRLVMAREKANEDGAQFLVNSGLVSVPNRSTGPEAKVDTLTYTETPRAGNPSVLEGSVIVLLPGDCAAIPARGETICNRKTLGLAAGDPRPFGAPSTLMQNHPVMAVAVGEVNGFLPWIGRRVIVSDAYAFRQPIPQSPFPAHEDPLLSGGGQEPPPDAPPTLLPAAEMPTPEPGACVVSAEKCVATAVNEGKPRCPGSIPDAEGVCECEPC